MSSTAKWDRPEIVVASREVDAPAGSNESDAGDQMESHAHVLVVEDDPLGGRLLATKLSPLGYRLSIVSSAGEAQERVKADPPDLVMSDILMPETDGIELTRWLRAQEETASVPVLLITAMDDSSVLERGLEAGADDFLTKPVNSLELRTRVASLLRSKFLAEELRAREEAVASFCSSAVVLGSETDLASASQESVGTSPASERNGHTILIIEDHDRERRLLEAFLKNVGCRIHCVRDGRSGLEVLKNRPPDLVVLDLLLPDISGYELIRQMKGKPELAQIPILAVSVLPDVEDRVKALEMGADDYIVKGFDRVEFCARVRRLLRFKHSLDRMNDRYNHAVRRAVTDSLTGLATHGFLREMLQHQLPFAQRHSQPFSLIFMDVDHFKQVNDRFGHGKGDQVLKAVAQTIVGVVRRSDTVARYGGDEFVALLPHTNREQATQLAERIRSAVESQRVNLPGGSEPDCLRVTISLGVAGFPQDATDAESLLQHADEALYAAKQAGRNCLFVFGQHKNQRSGRPRVLLVDDEEKNLRLLEAYLFPEGCEILKARDGEEALDLARHDPPDVILLDAIMPHLSGFDTCRRLKQESGTRLVPVVLVTALSGREDRLRGIEAGADDFLSKPINKEELLARIRALLRSKRATDLLEDAETVIFTLARAVEERQPSMGGHVERVSHYATELGRALGLPESQIEGLRRAGFVHDIGKVAVPDAILLKDGDLTCEEHKLMERHVEVGYELLRPLRTFAEALPAVRFHHERRDGSGYPLGLRGDQIPIVAQILAIVDVYDALTTDRVYRSGLSHEQAIRVLREEAERGLHDPSHVETFVRLIANQSSPSDDPSQE